MPNDLESVIMDAVSTAAESGSSGDAVGTGAAAGAGTGSAETSATGSTGTPSAAAGSGAAAATATGAGSTATASGQAAAAGAAGMGAAAGATPDPDDFDQTPQQITDVLGRQRENRIPHSVVKRMIEKRLAKATAEHTAKLQEVERVIERYNHIGEIMERDPERFLQIAAQANPAYARFLQGQGGAGAAGSGSDRGAEMPQPDFMLADGTFTYSQRGIQQLLEWQAAQTEARISQRFAPVAEDFQQRRIMEAAIPRVQAQLQEAASWPLFTESKAEILAALKADQSLTLERAYQRVVLPKLQANRDRMRQEILTEIGRAPAATSVPAAGGRGAGGADNTPRSMEETIAQAAGIAI